MTGSSCLARTGLFFFPIRVEDFVFALLSESVTIHDRAVNDLIREEHFHRIPVYMFDADLDCIALAIGVWQAYANGEY